MIPANKYEFWWLMTTGEFPCPNLSAGKTKNGYILIKNSNKNNVVQEVEHRIVMEEWLCRKLNRLELVHHINRIRTDNRLENLLICTAKEHKILHPKRRGWHHSPEIKARMSANHRTK